MITASLLVLMTAQRIVLTALSGPFQTLLALLAQYADQGSILPSLLANSALVLVQSHVRQEQLVTSRILAVDVLQDIFPPQGQVAKIV